MPSWAAHPRKADLKNVGIVGNVKFDYAQVMKVAPVYQTWHASHVEEQCDPLPLTEVAPNWTRVMTNIAKSRGSWSW